MPVSWGQVLIVASGLVAAATAVRNAVAVRNQFMLEQRSQKEGAVRERRHGGERGEASMKDIVKWGIPRG